MGSVITAGDLQWEVDSPCGDAGPDGCSTTQWTRAKALAANWLWALSGRKYGLVDVTFRPEWTIPVLVPPRPFALRGPDYWPRRATPPISKHITSAPLPGPVMSVTSVQLGSVVLDASAYTLIDGELVRVDGGVWPAYQSTATPMGADGTWEIVYVRGVPVPADGQWAAGVLACEMAQAMIGNKNCRLPNNTQTVARNGTTISLDAKQLQQGYTGIREVDQWCRMVNPKGHQSEPMVWSPDLDPGRFPAPPRV